MVKTSLSNAGGVGLIPGCGAKIPHASWPGSQNIKWRQCCGKFKKDFKKKMVHIKKKNLKKKKVDSDVRILILKQLLRK